MDVDPIRGTGAQPGSGVPRSPEGFLDWVAELHPDGSATTLADVVERARRIRGDTGDRQGAGATGDDDADWRPPFMTDVNARADGAAHDVAPEHSAAPADAPDGAGARLFAPTEVNAVYTGPGAAGQPGGGYPPPTPSGPPPTPGYGPPPGYPPAYGPPAYGRPPGYPPAYGRAPYPSPAYGPAPYAAPPPGYPPPATAQQLPSPYFDPNGTPGGGVLPAWDALPAQQRSEHFVGLPGWAQSLFWAQLNPPQRQELAAVLPPRPGA